jgi:hypothetical protein
VEVKLKKDNNLTLKKRDERQKERETARKYKVFFSHIGRWFGRLDGLRYVLVQLAFC